MARLAARKERLRRESEQTEAEKIELLRKLKARPANYTNSLIVYMT